MPRLPRLRLAGVPFHVIQRGNNRIACFQSDADRYRYMDEMRLLARSHEIATHAYVLMTNHIHLLVTAARDDELSLFMKHLGQRYVQYYNRVHDRSGSLWDGRFKSCLVDTEGYLLTCHRYIECNPVRAGMVTHPKDYPWSSYRCNAMGEPNPLVSMHPVIGALAHRESERLRIYQSLFDSELRHEELDEIRTMTNSGFALGSEAFKTRMAETLHRRVSWVGSGRNMTNQKGSDPF